MGGKHRGNKGGGGWAMCHAFDVCFICTGGGCGWVGGASGEECCR